jgi:hypothetical protein
MKKSLQFLFCISFLTASNALLSQPADHFRASVAAGINLSQMEGDGQQGYDKIGESIGVKGAYCFKPNFDMSAELLYNSRGSRPSRNAAPVTFLDKNVILNAELKYADIVLAANFHFMPDNNLRYYRQSLQIGLVYGRLLSSNISTNRGVFHDINLENELQDNLKKDDFGYMMGYTWFPIERLGICAKHTFSLRNIYANKKDGTSNQDYSSWIPYNLSVQLVYNIFSPKLNIRAQVEKAKKASERRKKNALEDL